ncbi:GumC family protein [Rivularia sp. UHCC 0363]|uniref:GumC family protein n=1 Tax=Rivularia sp. UHCC 0363 TaxID=3110244 RepID=UPI002B1F7558|nr:AAA family ATPase [Rivularia sp. UHCC 0363]MEA5593557.1 AAA family ATPase [Rivularia sp. UHCC 0363]
MTPPIVKRYLIAFDKYKWIGLASFGLVVAGSTILAVQPEPAAKFTVTGALAYTRPPVSFSATGSEIQQKGLALSKEVLLQDKVIESVAEKINVKPKNIAQNVAVSVPEPGENGQLASEIIGIKYQDTDGRRAQQTVLGLMQEMVKLSAEINTGRLKAIIDKIEERLPFVSKELQEAEKKLEQYDRIERPAILAAEDGSLLNAITGSQNQQRQIKLTVSGIDAQIRSLQQRLGLSAQQAYTSSALSADPIIANLRSQLYQVESQMEVLRKDLRPDHPTMIQLQRQKDAYEKLLQERANEVVGGGGVTAPLPNVSGVRAQSNLDPARQQLANQLVALQTQRETLQRQAIDLTQEQAKLQRDYALIPNKQLERSRLIQQVGLKKAVYDQMQAKLVDAKTAEAETVSTLAIAQPPVVIPQESKAKSIPITLGIGGFLGLLIGGGVIFLLGSLEGTFKTKEDIRKALKQREVLLLAELPIMPIEGTDQELVPVVLSADSPYMEFLEKFRSNLRRIGGKTVKVVLITSTGSLEGKTTSAYNLGIASARAGKRTLIIETDLRSPSRCESLKVNPDSNASIEPLRYYANSECIRMVPDVENLYIVPSPGPLRQSAAVLESSELRRLMEDSRERFDLVILDTTPLGLSNDALLIHPYSDGMIVVTRPNYTQENILGEAVDELVESDMGLLGVVINGADINLTFEEPIYIEESEIIHPEEYSTGVHRN